MLDLGNFHGGGGGSDNLLYGHPPFLYPMGG